MIVERTSPARPETKAPRVWTFEEAQEILEEGYDLLDELAQDPSDANRERFRRWEARNKEFLRGAH